MNSGGCDSKMYDMIVVGAGPAGLTAALYALRANKKVLVLEKSSFGGQMTFSPKIENFPGSLSVSGSALADSFVEQVLAQGADIELEEVLSVSAPSDGVITVTTDCGSHECLSVVIAVGAKHRLLGVPNEERFIGNGISFCAVCDGAFYEGKDVAVVGGGNSALQEALLLSDICKSVTVIQNLDFFTGEEKLVLSLSEKKNVRSILGTVVLSFEGNDSLTGLIAKRVSDGHEEKMDFDGVFVAIGLAPDTSPFKDILPLDKYGYSVSDESCLTGTPGIFAAGDCRSKKVRQITTAVSDGAAGALAAVSYIDGRL